MARQVNPKQRRFVTEYLIDLNATAAAGRAGYSDTSIGRQLITKNHVKEEIARQQAQLAAVTDITPAKVLERLWDLVEADPNELIDFRRTCCRYCWGVGNRWQYTQAEMEAARVEWQKKAEKAQSEGKTLGPFDEAGGIGYDRRKEPNQACQECFGEGVGEAFAKDTRKLSKRARRLYAGVKQTRHGLEIKMHDQYAALIDVARHLGMFPSKRDADDDDLTDAERVARIATILDRARSARAGQAPPVADDGPGHPEGSSGPIPE